MTKRRFCIVRIKNVHLRRITVIGVMPLAIALLLVAFVVEAIRFSLRAVCFEVLAVGEECGQAIGSILRDSVELMKTKPSL